MGFKAVPAHRGSSRRASRAGVQRCGRLTATLQDDHVADVAGTEQCWIADGWCERFDLPSDRNETGYDQDLEAAAHVRVNSADLLIGYHDAVHVRTLAFLATTSDADLDAIVDDRWDPPVTLGARLISIVADDLQHVGQAADARGILHRT